MNRPLLESDREDKIYDSLMAALVEAPEALSPEYSEDLLCELIRALVPDATNTEIVNALHELASRAVAFREVRFDQIH